MVTTGSGLVVKEVFSVEVPEVGVYAVHKIHVTSYTDRKTGILNPAL